MSDVQFETEQDLNQFRAQAMGQSGSGMANWLVKKGIVKSPEQATIILVVFMIFMFLASFVVLFSFTPVGNIIPRRSAEAPIPVLPAEMTP